MKEDHVPRDREAHSQLAHGYIGPRLNGNNTVLGSTYRVTTALSRPPARHTMSAMARVKQWVLWVFEGCSCLRTEKEMCLCLCRHKPGMAQPWGRRPVLSFAT